MTTEGLIANEKLHPILVWIFFLIGRINKCIKFILKYSYDSIIQNKVNNDSEGGGERMVRGLLASVRDKFEDVVFNPSYFKQFFKNSILKWDL